MDQPLRLKVETRHAQFSSNFTSSYVSGITYLSSQDGGSVMLSGLDCRFRFLLSLCRHGDGYTIYLCRLPGADYQDTDRVEGFYRQFSGQVVTEVNLQWSHQDQQWYVITDILGNQVITQSLPYNLRLEYDLKLPRRWWQSDQKSHHVITCHLALVPTPSVDTLPSESMVIIIDPPEP